jgi:hypothetical protein
MQIGRIKVRSVGASSAAALRMASFLFQVCDEDLVLSRVRQQDFPNKINTLTNRRTLHGYGHGCYCLNTYLSIL